eukprot:EG_transcript_8625
MAVTGRRENHPAMLMYQVTLALVGLTVLLGFIVVFVPIAQVDTAVGTRAFAYPFKTCFVNTFSTVNEQTCMDNDFIVGPKGSPLTGGNNTCKIYLLVAIGMAFVGVLGIAQTGLPLLLVLQRLWSRPIFLACLIQVVLVGVPAELTVAWAVFIVYSETTCAPNSIFPTHGYSYGFILLIFCTALSLGAAVTGFLGLMKLKKYQVLDFDEKDKDVYLDGQETEMSEGTVYDAPQVDAPLAAPTPDHSGEAHHHIV